MQNGVFRHQLLDIITALILVKRYRTVLNNQIDVIIIMDLIDDIIPLKLITTLYGNCREKVPAKQIPCMNVLNASYLYIKFTTQ